MRVIGELVFGCIAAAGAWAVTVPVVPGNSGRGEKLFETQRCVQCHGVNGKGGKTAPDLGRSVGRGFTPASLAIAMWNHAPVMWAAMQGVGIEKPKLTERDAADLFAYFYSSRFFDKPGDPVRGQTVFSDKHCGDCHGITESKAEGAPPVAKWQSLGHPTMLVQQMWNHSSHMGKAFARRKIEWQQLATEDLNDMLSYLRALPETTDASPSFSNTAGDRGQALFQSKGCINCHTGKLALENRLQNLTLTD